MFWVFTKFSDDSEKICRCHHVKVPWSPIVQSRSRSGPSGHFPQQPALLASSRSGRAGRGARGALGEPGGEMVGSARDADPPPTCQASPASRAPEPPPRGMCGMPAAWSGHLSARLPKKIKTFSGSTSAVGFWLSPSGPVTVSKAWSACFVPSMILSNGLSTINWKLKQNVTDSGVKVCVGQVFLFWTEFLRIIQLTNDKIICDHLFFSWTKTLWLSMLLSKEVVVKIIAIVIHLRLLLYYPQC